MGFPRRAANGVGGGDVPGFVKGGTGVCYWSGALPLWNDLREINNAFLPIN